MAGLASVTVTGTAGPGKSITAQVFNNVTAFRLDPVNAMLNLDQSDQLTQISIAAATTITVTLAAAAGNYTVTIS